MRIEWWPSLRYSISYIHSSPLRSFQYLVKLSCEFILGNVGLIFQAVFLSIQQLESGSTIGLFKKQIGDQGKKNAARVEAIRKAFYFWKIRQVD